MVVARVYCDASAPAPTTAAAADSSAHARAAKPTVCAVRENAWPGRCNGVVVVTVPLRGCHHRARVGVGVAVAVGVDVAVGRMAVLVLVVSPSRVLVRRGHRRGRR